MNPKIKWLRDKINMENMQGMIISNPVNIRYLTGITAEGILLITRKENFFYNRWEILRGSKVYSYNK